MIIFQYNCREDIGFVFKTRLVISYIALFSLGDYKYPKYYKAEAPTLNCDDICSCASTRL